ncbi:hypothetical protein TPA0910_52290 [Streptomyces hygroscopicus subsp. sporocinereus]|uniref:Uncharacterized protein n=1 Tax=Streptomyces hygroscopicus TaxID=1912 RepID=A0ABQ3U5X2_STRHY|nr:hypothetical protein [Streptomyces hygroscopicus]GHJ30796.1 hypothetical protein TPA0910_52290 [Streptomyces hygroscopicus]
MSKHTTADLKDPEGEERPLTARPATDRPPSLKALAEYFERACDRALSRSGMIGEGWLLAYAVVGEFISPRPHLRTVADRAFRSPVRLWGGFS